MRPRRKIHKASRARNLMLSRDAREKAKKDKEEKRLAIMKDLYAKWQENSKALIDTGKPRYIFTVAERNLIEAYVRYHLRGSR